MKCMAGVLGAVTLLLFLGGCSSSSSAKPSDGSSEKGSASKGSGGFYAEETFKGRLYVFGTEKAHASFKGTQQVPQIAKTFIGAGPEGQTLVLEADAKANDLQDRLKAEYEARHGAKLP